MYDRPVLLLLCFLPRNTHVYLNMTFPISFFSFPDLSPPTDFKSRRDPETILRKGHLGNRQFVLSNLLPETYYCTVYGYPKGGNTYDMWYNTVTSGIFFVQKYLRSILGRDRKKVHQACHNPSIAINQPQRIRQFLIFLL